MAAFAFTGTAAAQSVTILGGGVKGQPYQFAVAQSKILKEHGNISATPQSSQGIPAQARLVARGEANFAWGLGGPGLEILKRSRKNDKISVRFGFKSKITRRGLLLFGGQNFDIFLSWDQIYVKSSRVEAISKLDPNVFETCQNR